MMTFVTVSIRDLRDNCLIKRYLIRGGLYYRLSSAGLSNPPVWEERAALGTRQRIKSWEMVRQ